MSSESRPGRRWFQFSLRALLILALIAGIAFAALRYKREVELLHAKLEQAKAERDLANQTLSEFEMLVEFQRSEIALTKREAKAAIREMRRELDNALRQDKQFDRDAFFNRFDAILEKRRELLGSANTSLK